MNEKIDVLAVMDRAADRAALLPELATDLTNARAAIAELIEDMRKIKQCAELGIFYHSTGPGHTEGISRIAEASLARIGGAK